MTGWVVVVDFFCFDRVDLLNVVAGWVVVVVVDFFFIVLVDLWLEGAGVTMLEPDEEGFLFDLDEEELFLL